jgi:hypothetical protein
VAFWMDRIAALHERARLRDSRSWQNCPSTFETEMREFWFAHRYLP